MKRKAAIIESSRKRWEQMRLRAPLVTTTTTANKIDCPAGVTIGTNTTQRAATSPYVLSGSPRSELSPVVPLGSIENDEIKIVSGRTWREDQKIRGQVMFPNLEKNPTSICIDSGAGESVCPVDFFPDYETHQTDKGWESLQRTHQTDKGWESLQSRWGQELRNMGKEAAI